MNVSLTNDLAELVRRKVESGLYASASEVIRDALRLLAQQDHLNAIREEELRKQIAQGVRSAEEGPLIDGDEAFDRLEARIRQLEQERPGE